jgi:hypothetical protein
MLRFLTDAGGTTHVFQSRRCSAARDACSQLEGRARSARQSFPVEALGIHMRQPTDEVLRKTDGLAKREGAGGSPTSRCAP